MIPFLSGQKILWFGKDSNIFQYRISNSPFFPFSILELELMSGWVKRRMWYWLSLLRTNWWREYKESDSYLQINSLNNLISIMISIDHSNSNDELCLWLLWNEFFVYQNITYLIVTDFSLNGHIHSIQRVMWMIMIMLN